MGRKLNKIKSVVKSSGYDVLKEHIRGVIDNENRLPIDVMKLNKDEVLREAAKRYGRAQIMDILNAIEEEALQDKPPRAEE